MGCINSKPKCAWCNKEIKSKYFAFKVSNEIIFKFCSLDCQVNALENIK